MRMLPFAFRALDLDDSDGASDRASEPRRSEPRRCDTFLAVSESTAAPRDSRAALHTPACLHRGREFVNLPLASKIVRRPCPPCRKTTNSPGSCCCVPCPTMVPAGVMHDQTSESTAGRPHGEVFRASGGCVPRGCVPPKFQGALRALRQLPGSTLEQIMPLPWTPRYSLNGYSQVEKKHRARSRIERM